MAALSSSETTRPDTQGSFWSRNWQKVVAVVIWITIVATFFIYAQVTHGSPFAFEETVRDLVGLLESPFGPLVYIVVYALRPLAFFSAIVLTLLGGSIWGPIFGVLYTIIAANTSATVAYMLGRILGQGVIDEGETEGFIAGYVSRLRRNVFQTVLIMRLIYLPYDLVNYLGGFLRVDYKSFILATILGSLPGTVTFVLAGASISLTDALDGNVDASVFNPWALAASAVLFVGSLFFSRWLKGREAAKMEDQPTSAPSQSDNEPTA